MNDPLISTDELADVLGSVTLLDVRYRLGGPSGTGEYLAGHVPGAAYVDLDADLAGPGEGRHPLPDPAAFERSMRRVGVRGSRPVVVYDDWSARAAGRAWWLLRFHGHGAVRVLDGGWAEWLRVGGPLETGERRAEAGDFVARPGGMPVVEAAGVLAMSVLVDARAPQRYRGEVEPVDPVAGHIPGAVNVPTEDNLDELGRFRDAAQLRERYAAVGATTTAGAAGKIAAYCGSGVSAAHDVLAMEIAGVRAALYPGSWSGWISDPRRITSGCP